MVTRCDIVADHSLSLILTGRLLIELVRDLEPIPCCGQVQVKDVSAARLMHASAIGIAWSTWPIARSAADLLASDQLAYVRACSSKVCEWFFLDTSKNHHRRWCDMTRCGNRAKVAAHRKRLKERGNA